MARNFHHLTNLLIAILIVSFNPIISASTTILEPSFETVNNWSFINNGGISGGVSTFWTTNGTYSYEFSRGTEVVGNNASISQYIEPRPIIKKILFDVKTYCTNYGNPCGGGYESDGTYLYGEVKINNISMITFPDSITTYLDNELNLSNYSSFNLQFFAVHRITTTLVNYVYFDNIRLILNNISTTPNISLPINNSRHYNNSINYTWNKSTDLDGDTLLYDFWLSSQSNFSNTINRTNFSNNWTGNITGLTDGVTYFGKVRTWDGYEYSDWSNTTQFTENSKPVYSNITLSPSTPIDADNLIATLNLTDAEGDTVTNYTRWYKNNVLQTALNDSINVTGINTSVGETWRFEVFGNDGHENSTVISSNEVIIGSSNSAPTFTSLVLTPSTGQFGSTININASGIVDDSTSWRAQTYFLATDLSKVYLGNSTWSNLTHISYNIASPWSDSNTRTIYTEIYDSGNVTGVQNLTSSPQTAYYTSQITVLTNPGVGGSGNPIPTPVSTIIQTQPKYRQININDFATDPWGRVLIQIFEIMSVIILWFGFRPEGETKTKVLGVIFLVPSAYMLGHLSWFIGGL